MKLPVSKSIPIILLLLFAGCVKKTGHEKMVNLLSELNGKFCSVDNFFCPEAKVLFYDSMALAATTIDKIHYNKYMKAYFLLQTGEFEQAAQLYESLLPEMKEASTEAIRLVHLYLGLAYQRIGERQNCITTKTAESCIFPIQDSGVFRDNSYTLKAIEHYKNALIDDENNLEVRWLLNIAVMTLGGYPEQVPSNLLIPSLMPAVDSTIIPFTEIAPSVGIDVNDMSGGSLVEDFNLDGSLDIAISSWALDEPMHLWFNNGDGTFRDASASSRLGQFTGGLNIQQTDYNNDGYPDIFVLRGGWQQEFGEQPNSLLRNNGDETFTDVTIESGLFSYHPTQTATWSDFNNDGWIDVFIGNESLADPHPCELFINKQNGTFENVAHKAGIGVISFVKAVTSGDYNNDGLHDIFISTMSRKSFLFQNVTKGREVKFEDVTEKAGLSQVRSKTFPAWFWDYNNDGLLDIFNCSYEFEKSLGFYEAAQKLQHPLAEDSKMKLYRNNGDGTFTNVAADVGLDQIVNAMGANFGDINNDGFLDIYLGTGNPDSKSLVPNKMFINVDGKTFKDVTSAVRVGHLQKGHGVSFADIDHDGDQDIHMDVGGSFKGDSFQNSLYINPGQNSNNRVVINLVGDKSNKLGIGSKLKIIFREDGKSREVYREVNSGGSFGSSPIRQHIGVGKASVIDRIEITWAGTLKKQTFENLDANKSYEIRENENEVRVVERPSFQFRAAINQSTEVITP